MVTASGQASPGPLRSINSLTGGNPRLLPALFPPRIYNGRCTIQYVIIPCECGVPVVAFKGDFQSHSMICESMLFVTKHLSQGAFRNTSTPKIHQARVFKPHTTRLAHGKVHWKKIGLKWIEKGQSYHVVKTNSPAGALNAVRHLPYF